MLHNYIEMLFPSILSLTLNELVGLKTPDDPWEPTELPARSNTSNLEKLPDTNFQRHSNQSKSFDEPKFHHNWGYWPVSLAHANPKLPMKDDRTADPWDLSLNLDPPFYRRFCMEPPYESGMGHPLSLGPSQQDSSSHLPDIARLKTPLPSPQCHQLEHCQWKTSPPGGHNGSPSRSHL